MRWLYYASRQLSAAAMPLLPAIDFRRRQPHTFQPPAAY